MLLTDIVMPEMDGIELARRASELDPDIKIMFITGFAAVALNSDSEAPEERQGAVQAGPPARPGQRSEQDAGGLIRPAFRRKTLPGRSFASLPARFGADIGTPPRSSPWI
jgi:CheY-like chemotaxis protein